jgi:hypothetical protein
LTVREGIAHAHESSTATAQALAQALEEHDVPRNLDFGAAGYGTDFAGIKSFRFQDGERTVHFVVNLAPEDAEAVVPTPLMDRATGRAGAPGERLRMEAGGYGWWEGR